MKLSIFEIANSISWTEDKRIYLRCRENVHELLCEYLSGFEIINLIDEIERLKETQQALNSGNRILVEKHFVDNLIGFDDDGIHAYVGGATDFSVKILYNIEQNLILLKHVYGDPDEQYQIALEVLLELLYELKQVFHLLVKDEEIRFHP